MDMSISCSTTKFPQLAPRYHGMPRRYEETKPVVIQDFTHRKIVGIGHEIQRRLLEKLEAEKQDAMHSVETTTWEKAERKKQSAVRRVREEAALQIEKALDNQRREHEQKLKEEIVRVEMALQKMAIERVQEERARGEKVLEDTIKLVEERCAEELQQAVAKARREEQHVAAEKIKELKEKHKAEIENLRKEHVVELAQSLALLTARKDQEREEAVTKAHAFERKVTEQVVRELRERYEAQIAAESAKIKEKNSEIEKVAQEMAEVKKEKERLAEYLKTTRFWFQDFIDKVQHVQKGYADYILPPAYIKEIEKGLMTALPPVKSD